MLGAVSYMLRRWHMFAMLCHIFLSCIRPVLLYGNAVTSGKSAENTSAVERVNRMAATMVLNNYTPMDNEALLKKVKWRTFEWEATREQLCLVYKHVKKATQEGSTTTMKWIVPETTRRASRLNHSRIQKIQASRPRLQRTTKCASYQMVAKWNLLTEEEVNAASVNTFLKELDRTSSNDAKNFQQ